MSTTLALRGRARPGGKVDVEALYREARDDVYAYVASLLGDRAAAEDVVGVAFERALRKRGSFRPERGTARAWLFGIARNAALDELRRRRRSAGVVSGEPEVEAASVEDEAERALRLAEVRAALAGLAPRDREVIALRFHAGLDTAELAAVLQITPGNVGTLLHRALQKLRRRLDDDAQA